MAITTNALARALSLSCSEGISSHDIIFLQALNHISNWNLFIRHTFHPSLRANVHFVHYILIVVGLLLTRWENYCTRRSGSLAYLQPIQPSSHNDFHDCTKQWHGHIPTTPVKMQTGKRPATLCQPTHCWQDFNFNLWSWEGEKKQFTNWSLLRYY